MATTTFDNLITFSRGSNATVVGSNGLVQWAPSNLLTNSQDFEAAAWVKFGATTVANSISAPDGTFTADTLTENTSTGQHGVYQGATVVSGIVYTWSGYVRNNGRSIVQFQLQATANVYFVEFDLTAETTTNRSGSGSASITNVGNGWYRITATATATGSGTGYWQLNLCSAANTPSYTGDGVSGVRVWGAQLELGSTATTYNNTSVRNLLGFSEAFDNALWTKTGASIVSGAQANPVNGLFNAQKLMENTTTGEHIAYNGGVNISAGPVTASIYAKPAGRDWLVIRETLLDGASYVNTFFNIATGTIGTVGAGRTASITNVGNGWYRCSITTTSNAAASRFVGFETSTNGSVFSYTGDGNSGVYIYGAMLSNSASLDPYVPTPGAAPSSTAYYGPRFDYDPVTLLPRGFLVEEARTNFLRYSNEFDNVVWTNASPSIPTVTTNTATAPDGTITADTLTAATGGTSSQTRQIASSTGATGNFTGSVFLKAGTSTRSRIIVVDSTSSFNVIGDFAIAWSGGVASVQSVTLGTASVTAVGNGWYRCALTASAPSANASVALAIFPDILVGTNSVVAWGAQLEAGAFATSYIPTIASTVTRSADVATITGSLFSQWWNRQEGAFIVEGVVAPNVDGAIGNYYYSASDGTISNMLLSAEVNGTVSQVIAGGVTQFNETVGGEPTGVLKVALAYQANNTVSSANGAIGTTDTSVTLPTVDRLGIGGRGDLSATSYLNGHIRSIRYVPVRAADFQLQQVTT